MKTKKKLIASIFALVVAVSLAATTTYAWFTANTEVNVGSMQMHVTTADQTLLVSTVKDGPYATAINLGEYIKAITTMSQKKVAAGTSSLLGFTKANPAMPVVTDHEYVGFEMMAATYEPTKGFAFKNNPIATDYFASNIYEGEIAELDSGAIVGTPDADLLLPATKAAAIERATLVENNSAGAASITNAFEIDLDLLRKGILSFNLYFRGYDEYDVVLNMAPSPLEAANKPSVTVGADTTSGKARAWGPLTEAVYGQNIVANAALATRAANAVRVGFGIESTGTNAGKNFVNIWEPNAIEGFSFNRAGSQTVTTGVRNMAQDYWETIMNSVLPENLPTAIATPNFPNYAPSLISAGSSFDLDATADVNYSTRASSTHVDYATGAAYQKSLVKLLDTGLDYTIPANPTGTPTGVYEGMMTITIWLEGWDEDCLDNITTDTFNVQLSFTVADPDLLVTTP